MLKILVFHIHSRHAQAYHTQLGGAAVAAAVEGAETYYSSSSHQIGRELHSSSVVDRQGCGRRLWLVACASH